MKTLWAILLLSASCFAQGILAPILQKPPAGGGGATFTQVGTVKTGALAFGDNSFVLNQVPTSGNLLVCRVSVTNPTAVASTVKTSGATSFNVADTANDGSNIKTDLFYLVSPAGITATLTIHVEWSGGSANASCNEYNSSTGFPAGTASLDAHAAAFTGFTVATTFTTGSASTTATDMLIGAVGCNIGITAPFVAGSGYTSVTTYTAGSPNAMLEHNLSAVSGSYVADGSVTGNPSGTRYAVVFAAFKGN